MDYNKVEEHIVVWLRERLPDDLYYHGIHHTLDVLDAAERYARLEGLSEEDRLLVKTAALYHDAGFVQDYFKNEPLGADIAAEQLPDFGYSDAQIEKIRGMILATTLPQTPKNYLEEILCDADLDYLGREDFYAIAHCLKREWGEYGMGKTLRQWYEQQVKFVQNHTYFTDSAKKLRDDKKALHVAQMYELLNCVATVAR